MQEATLDEKVALVTGASRGIGRAIARKLAQHGARVALAARTCADLQALEQEIVALGGQAASLVADISREKAAVALVHDTVSRFGRLDILVNNAGTGVFGPLVETTTGQWDRVMAVNVRGPFIICREAIPFLRQQQRSFIVNISSVVGLKGYPNQSVYGASKHALMGMTKALAREVQADGIRVHAVCPGGVDTDLIRSARPDLDAAVLIQPDEVADIVLFLVTRDGNAVIDQVNVRRAASTPWA